MGIGEHKKTAYDIQTLKEKCPNGKIKHKWRVQISAKEINEQQMKRKQWKNGGKKNMEKYLN